MLTRRRIAFALFVSTLLPLASFAQQRKVSRIGFLRAVSFSPQDQYLLDILVRRLSELGYFEGKNLVIERRSADGSFERLASLAAELVNLQVDLIVVFGTQGAKAAKEVTTTITIVMVNASDPEANGIVKSLARPDGNITGTSNLTGQLGAKNLEVLLDIAPNLRRIAALHDPSAPATPTILRNIQTAAAKASVSMFPVAVRTSEELRNAFPTMVRQGVGAVVIVAGGLFRQEIQTIAALCIKHGLLSAATNMDFPRAGILLSYSSDATEIFRLSATYVDRILKGAKPGDLPIEQPTKFELVINTKTAKAIGISIPTVVLVRGPRLIE